MAQFIRVSRMKKSYVARTLYLFRSCSHSSLYRYDKETNVVSIGDLSHRKYDAKNAEYIPYGYFQPENITNWSIYRWMLQKDSMLHQDFFLLGHPGPERRQLVLRYAEMMGREVEYLPIGPDTCESDLKQRREIIAGTSVFIDQAPVRAAIHGRVLILDGLEKAERNVLPTLNNLLENREMALEDGRFLLPLDRYQVFDLQDGKTEAFVPVHPDFRVVALGLPVPPYPGRTLDPPLRSRFQARSIEPLEGHELLHALHHEYPEIALEDLKGIIQQTKALQISQQEQQQQSSSVTQRLPSFPLASGLHHWSRIYASSKGDPSVVMQRMFPYLNDSIPFSSAKEASYQELCSKLWTKAASPVSKEEFSRQEVQVDTPGYVLTPTTRSLLTHMKTDHSVGKDLCLFGPKGCGKSHFARVFGSSIGSSEIQMMHLYQDMTARDLIQRRSTIVSGANATSTVWEDSPLIKGAKEGHLVILDGIHRLSSGTLSLLQRLMQDREIDLFDGMKLRSHKTCHPLFLEEDHASKTIGLIHPNFRILCLAEFPTTGGHSTGFSSWISEEDLHSFAFHYFPKFSFDESKSILSTLYPKINGSTNFQKLLEFSGDSTEVPFSFRQMLRLCQQLSFSAEPNSVDMSSLIYESIYLPTHSQYHAPFMSLLESSFGSKPTVAKDPVQTIEQHPETLQIDELHYPLVSSPSLRPELIPQPLFYPIPQHLGVLKSMLKHLIAGQPHLLLIGNQGVGKNKLADQLLSLMRKEREYIQLHRDTTVQSLTLVPSLTNGKMTWEDSPLIKAVEHGRTLIIDEADKAPVEVVCILKSLIEDGEMLLGDGRRIIDPSKGFHDLTQVDTANTILVSPNFQMWILANAPGFPFLGNDFFHECGDVFALHVIENPDAASELKLLQSYGPQVSPKILERLILSFQELRGMYDQQELLYPYSTREAIAIVKHLNAFPQDGIQEAIDNVLAFDSFQSELRNKVAQIFQENGLYFDASLKFEFAKSRKLLMRSNTHTLVPSKKAAAGTTITAIQTQHGTPVASFRPIEQYFLPVHHTSRQDPKVIQEERSAFRLPSQHLISAQRTTRQTLGALSSAPPGLFLIEASTPQEKKQKNDQKTCSFYSFDSTPFWSEHPRDIQMLALQDSFVFYFPSHSQLLWLNSNESKTFDLSSLCSTSDSATSENQDWVSSFLKSERGNTTNPLAFQRQSFSSSSEDHFLAFYQSNVHLMHLSMDDAPHLRHQTLVLPGQLEIDQCQWIESNLILFKSKNTKDWFWIHWQEEDPENVQVIPCLFEERAVVNNEVEGTSMCMKELDFCKTDTQAFNNATSYVVSLVHPQEGHVVLLEPSSTSFTRDLIENSHSSQVHTLASVVPPSATMKHIHAHVHGNRQQILLTDDQQHVYYISIPALESREISMTLGGNVLAVHFDDSNSNSNHHSNVVHLTGENGSNVELALDLEQEHRLYTQYSAKSSVPKTKWDKPKVGQFDSTNAPHVGGNTWAGGSGGSDTAGLGGRGGPYRLDLGHGHAIHQVSQADKDAVSSKIRHQAAEMAKTQLEHELSHLNMSPKEWAQYNHFYHAIASQRDQLRHILDEFVQLSTRSKHQPEGQNVWQKHQSSGEWDENKLVDGFVGEKLVFKRRRRQEERQVSWGLSTTGDTSEEREPQPKIRHRFLFLMDISGSMYRFNSHDQRLERLLETTLMIMSSFQKDIDTTTLEEGCVDYAIVGHNGASGAIPLVPFSNDHHHSKNAPPTNQKEQFDVLRQMHLHAQFCPAGDHTVEALDSGMAMMMHSFPSELDEKHVFLVSDANLRRYDIKSQDLQRPLDRFPDIRARVIFLATLGSEAHEIVSQLRPGEGHVCLETQDLPLVFQKILRSSMSN